MTGCLENGIIGGDLQRLFKGRAGSFRQDEDRSRPTIEPCRALALIDNFCTQGVVVLHREFDSV